MIPRTIMEEPAAHLVLHLRGAGVEAEAKPLSAEEKVVAFVEGLAKSPLFEQQSAALAKWQVQALPEFKVVDTRDKKLEAAENLALLYIDVIVPAKMAKANLRRQRDIDLQQKALELLLKVFLPIGSSAKAFLAEQQAADKMTAQLVGQMAIASHATNLKFQALAAEEEALNQKLLAHFEYVQAQYLKLAENSQEQVEGQRERFLALGIELQEIHVALKSKVVKTEEIAAKLQASEKTLQVALASCQATLNQRITR